LHAKPLNILRDFSDIFFDFTYDGEGEVAWPEYLEDLYAFLIDEFYVEETSVLLASTLLESPLQWC